MWISKTVQKIEGDWAGTRSFDFCLVIFELDYIMLNLFPLIKTQAICLFLQSKVNVITVVQVTKQGKMWNIFATLGLKANKQFFEKGGKKRKQNLQVLIKDSTNRPQSLQRKTRQILKIKLTSITAV